MTNEKDLTFDGFKGAASLFTYEKDVQAKSGYLGGIFIGLRALSGSSGATDG